MKALGKSLGMGTGGKTATAFVDKKWVKQDGWCSLCTEPFANWTDHVSGRFRDHRCLEMFYDVITQQECRTWKPLDAVRNAAKLPSIKILDLHEVQSQDDISHRIKLHHVLSVICDAGVFKNSFQNNQHMGNVALIKGSHYVPLEVMKLLLTVFPGYDAGYLSDLLQMICDCFNYEATYYSLQANDIFKDMEGIKALKPHNIFKSVIGDLYYTSTRRAGRKEYNADVHALSQYALVGCIAELVLLKFADYTARVDRVWRVEHGGPVNNPTLKGNASCINSTHPTVLHPASTYQINALFDDPERSNKKKLCIHSYNTNRMRFKELFSNTLPKSPG